MGVARLGLTLLLGAGVFAGCATQEGPRTVNYHGPSTIYQPAPGTPEAAGPVTTADNSPAQPQVVRSIQVPQSSLPPGGGLSVAEILTQIKGGKPAADMINDIRARGLNAPLKQADVDLMAANNVPKEVVDAALSAPVNTVVAEAPAQIQRNYYYYPWVPFTLGLYWGSVWRPYYYPYYSYAPRYYGPRYYGPIVPRSYGYAAPSYRYGLPGGGGGWGGGGRGRWR